jgi:hypothetical protein
MPLPSLDPSELLDSLDPAALRRRLDELDGERRAVVTLLRAASARERARPAPRQTTPTAEGGPNHAA